MTEALRRYNIPVAIDGLKYYDHDDDFNLENGGVLKNLTLAYHSFGRLNEAKDNVIWVCHALTANSDASDWWSGLFGEGKILDPSKYFIVCVNIIGSNYGSTGARSINPETNQAYGLDFPLVTIKDIARSHYLLAEYLGINKIALAIGGSCGGHQILEMCLLKNIPIDKATLLVTSAKETPWSIAIHEAQRLALKADPSFTLNRDEAGQKGLKASRGMGLIGYRTFLQYKKQQEDHDDRYKNFKASSYINYQGDKLVSRFYAHCYYHLMNTLDTHNIGRNRGGIETALSEIESDCLIISIDSDVLIPEHEQRILAEHISNSKLEIISSRYGHDGFLIESERINELGLEFLNSSHSVNKS